MLVGTTAMLTQLSVSAGGMPKLPVLAARVSFNGIEGDHQRIRKIHGGPCRAVCLYSEELYEWLREQGIGVHAGQIGENFTTRGLELAQLTKGDRLRVGPDAASSGRGCVIQITAVREPCIQLKKWDADLPELIVGRSGWVARVLEEGVVAAGDSIVLLS